MWNVMAKLQSCRLNCVGKIEIIYINTHIRKHPAELTQYLKKIVVIDKYGYCCK